MMMILGWFIFSMNFLLFYIIKRLQVEIARYKIKQYFIITGILKWIKNSHAEYFKQLNKSTFLDDSWSSLKLINFKWVNFKPHVLGLLRTWTKKKKHEPSLNLVNIRWVELDHIKSWLGSTQFTAVYAIAYVSIWSNASGIVFVWPNPTLRTATFPMKTSQETQKLTL